MRTRLISVFLMLLALIFLAADCAMTARTASHTPAANRINESGSGSLTAGGPSRTRANLPQLPAGKGAKEAALTEEEKTSNFMTPETFLQKYELKVNGDPEKITVKIPESWQVSLGEYPEGLYWGMANEFSKDAGLDLSNLKGETVEALVYRLQDGLPGPGDQAQYSYPSDLIMLVRDGKTVGAWLSFNTRSIGPSVRKKTLQDLTGLTFDQWSAREGYFSDAGKNSDLAALSPTEVIAAFFTAIDQGNKTRAVACLTPQNLLGSLTDNLEPGRLYNNGFSTGNSLVENIIEGEPISYKLLDPDHPSVELNEVGNRQKIEVYATLRLKWRDAAFNTANGISGRFAVLYKEENGWKLDGLGTGP